jgi:hypothetical protein
MTAVLRRPLDQARRHHQSGVTASFAYSPDGERFRKVRSGSTTLWLGPDIEILTYGTLPSRWAHLVASPARWAQAGCPNGCTAMASPPTG